jgi:acyl dehydratase
MDGMTGRDFTQLPEQVRLDETITSADERPVQAPEGDRNPALWDALEAGG